LEHRNPFTKEGKESSIISYRNPFTKEGKESSIISYSYWQDFYRNLFRVDIDLSKLEIPKPQGDFTWPIVTIERVNEQMLYDKCAGLFPCWKWTKESLNKVLIPDITSKGTYIALFRDRVEADEELKNLSADDLKEKNIQGITLKQRLVMELDYFGRTGNHLDIKCFTICSGSRCSGGGAPNVGWGGGRVRVIWLYSDDRNGNLRSRQQFSFS